MGAKQFLTFLFMVLVSVRGSTKQMFQQHRFSQNRNGFNATKDSYKCSSGEIQFQYDNIDLVSPHICEPFGMMTPWQLVQMIYPDIKTFLDIGGNRGYTAAEFFGLWSPGHGLNRINLHNALKSDAEKELLSNVDQINTYCRDGLKQDKPMICFGRYNAPCLTRRSITVYSFDGQKTHVRDSTDTVARHFPQLNINYTVDPEISIVKATWVYTHAAMTDEIPPGVTHGYFKVSTHEGGQLIKSQKDTVPAGTNMVPLLTVDKFCEDNELTHVPILKVDAEGHDIAVLHGARQTLLHRGVKVINYECWNCMSTEWQETFHSLDVDYGFDCYQIGQYNMFVRVTNCWDYSVAKMPAECTAKSNPNCPEYIQNHPPKARLDGNGMCIHRKRSALLNAMFDQMSLYKFHDNHRGDVYKDGLLSNIKAQYDSFGKVIAATKSDKEAFTRRTGRDFVTGVKQWKLSEQ